MSDLTITITGNLAARPELRYTQTGQAVANVTIIHNARLFDKKTNAWVDGAATSIRGSVWSQQAEEVASLEKGTRVIAVGVLSQREWEDRETGKKQYALELHVDEIGESMKWGRKSRVATEDAWEPAPVGASQYGDDTPF